MKRLFALILCASLLLSLAACGNRRSAPTEDPHAAQATPDLTTYVYAPVSSDGLQDLEYTEIAQAFSDAGFLNVQTDVVCDQDPDVLASEFLNTVSIGYTSSFATGEKFAETTPVQVTCHLPYVKYDAVIHIGFIPNLLFSKYDVDYAVNGEAMGTLTHGEDKDLTLRLREGEYTLTFSEKGASSNCTDLVFDLRDDMEAAYKLSCASNKITLDTLYVEKKHAAGEGQAMVPDSAANFKYKNYKEVVAKLEKAGFTNITTDILYDIVFGWTDEGEVKSVMIDAETEFSRGDVFAADAPVVITYHMKEADDPAKAAVPTPAPSDSTTAPETPVDTPDDAAATQTPEKTNAVSYSTNDQKTAKKGNSGVFSYKSIGYAYDAYYIVDFEQGYVYYFSEGNENAICDRVKIDSGDLNNVLIITYHDGKDKWSYGLHFKWKNQPDHLIVQSEDGFESDYYTTNLKDALAIRDTKTIRDY